MLSPPNQIAFTPLTLFCASSYRVTYHVAYSSDMILHLPYHISAPISPPGPELFLRED